MNVASLELNASLQAVIAGLLAMGYAVAAMFFFRFYRESRDRLFLFFSGAFTLLAVQRVVLVIFAALGHDTLSLYVVRLVAFVLILIAILDKNRKVAR